MDEKILPRFTADVAKHEMTVVIDNGLYRHLRFAEPHTYCQSFDLVTWPGHLCYSGDMGTYVFSRIDDMFQFFRRPLDEEHIPLQYWAEKCIADDKPDGIRAYSEERFRAAVKSDFDTFVEHRSLTPDEAANLWQEIEDYIYASSENQHDAMNAVTQFRWGTDYVHEVFPDFWEHRLEEYTPRFVWCCYALRWAIAQYDAVKLAPTCKVCGARKESHTDVRDGVPGHEIVMPGDRLHGVWHAYTADAVKQEAGNG